jgi:hypothetical protein
MALAPRLAEYVNACFTGLWIQSHEHDDALSEIARLCQSQDWRLAIWDIDRGLSIPGSDTSVTTGPADPLAAIRALSSLAGETGSTLLVLVNFHRFLQSAEVVQALAHQISAGKQRRTFVVILSPVVQIPVELEKQLVILEHELPGRDQLAEIARGVATEPHELPTGADEDRLLDASRSGECVQPVPGPAWPPRNRDAVGTERAVAQEERSVAALPGPGGFFGAGRSGVTQGVL